MQNSDSPPHQHLRSSLPGAKPCPEELADGEISVNTADACAYIKDVSGQVRLLNGPSMNLAAAQRAFAASILFG